MERKIRRCCAFRLFAEGPLRYCSECGAPLLDPDELLCCGPLKEVWKRGYFQHLVQDYEIEWRFYFPPYLRMRAKVCPFCGKTLPQLYIEPRREDGTAQDV